MAPYQIQNQTNRAAIILAGGEGTRLADLTRRAGVHVPKQFCALVGNDPLLQKTRRRVALSVPAERVFFALSKNHEGFYSPLLADAPRQNLVVQPRSRGTAPAILYSLLRLAKSTGQATVLLMPSDHHVSDEALLAQHVDVAFEAVEKDPGLTVLLGVTAVEPETSYGWIEPQPSSHAAERDIRRVRRFWEKPTSELARQLMAGGCLWNTFITIAQLPTLAGLFALSIPALYLAFSKIRLSLGTMFEQETVRRLYDDLEASDFSRDVLQAAAGSLSVLRVSDVGWTDLGEPHRAARVLADLDIQRKEAAA
jgi:mannose-1-phosphate guanylyltransferase